MSVLRKILNGIDYIVDQVLDRDDEPPPSPDSPEFVGPPLPPEQTIQAPAEVAGPPPPPKTTASRPKKQAASAPSTPDKPKAFQSQIGSRFTDPKTGFFIVPGQTPEPEPEEPPKTKGLM